MVLNRNPSNYFAEVEQAAFSPANLVPGIGASPDKMLQGRLFAYHDAHRYRLGPNYLLLPVNQPKGVKAKNYQRDGYMRFDGNDGDAPNYYPNSFGGPEPDVKESEPAFEVSGRAARQPYTHPNSDFVQPGDLYRKVMTDVDREHLIGNIVTHLFNANKEIQLRQARIFYKADPEYGQRVAEGCRHNTVKQQDYLFRSLIREALRVLESIVYIVPKFAFTCPDIFGVVSS